MQESLTILLWIYFLFCLFVLLFAGAETRVLESQRLETVVENGEVKVSCKITPENAMRSVFRIETTWRISVAEADPQSTAPGVTVEVRGEAELLRRIWGFQSYAEGLLADRVSTLFLCFARI